MLGAVAESVEHGTRVREVVGSYPGRIKPMPYKIDRPYVSLHNQTIIRIG